MNGRIERYVISQVLELTGIVALALVSIYTLVVFVSGIGETGKGDYGVFEVLEYALLMVPGSLYTLMPVVALLGTLLGVGNLARNSELVAMRAAGVSLNRIGAATLLAGAALALCSFALGDWLAPAGERLATTLRDTARGGNTLARTKWLRSGTEVLRINDLQSEDSVRDVTAFHLNGDSGLLSIATAAEGHYVDGKWQLAMVRRTDFGAGRTAVSAFDHFTLEGGIDPTVLKLFVLEAGDLSVRGLMHLIGFMDENHLNADKYRMLLWRKLFEPFTVMAMMLFAVPFVSAQLRDANAGQKLLAGAIVGIVFYVTNKVSVSLGDIYAWPAPLAAGIPTMLLAVIAVWRMAKAR